MHDNSFLALLILLGCLVAMWPLSRAELFGPMAVTGFVLGAASAVSVVVLLQ